MNDGDFLERSDRRTMTNGTVGLPPGAMAPQLPQHGTPGPYVPAAVKALDAKRLHEAWQVEWNGTHVSDLRRVLPLTVYGIADAVAKVDAHLTEGQEHAAQHRGAYPYGHADETTRLRDLVQVDRKKEEARFSEGISAYRKAKGDRTTAPDYYPHNAQAQRQLDTVMARAEQSPVSGVIAMIDQRIPRALEIEADGDVRAELQSLAGHLERRLAAGDKKWNAELAARPIGEENPATLALATVQHTLVDQVAWNARAANQIIERLEPQANFVFRTIEDGGRYTGTMRSRMEGNVGGRETSPVEDLEPLPE